MRTSALIDSLEIGCSPRVSETKLKQSQTDNREAETSACMSYGGSFILSNNSLQVEMILRPTDPVALDIDRQQIVLSLQASEIFYVPNLSTDSGRLNGLVSML